MFRIVRFVLTLGVSALQVLFYITLPSILVSRFSVVQGNFELGLHACSIHYVYILEKMDIKTLSCFMASYYSYPSFFICNHLDECLHSM